MSRTYSQKDREAALAKCVEVGAYQASTDLGIPRSTLAFWMRRAGLHCTDNREKLVAANEERAVRIATKRTALQERMLEEAAYCMEAIHNEHVDFKSAGPSGPVKVIFPVAPAAAVQHYATALGILIDKFRLENGEVTSRDEHRNVEQSELDRDIGTLLEEMARREKASVTAEATRQTEVVSVGASLPDAEAE